VSAEERPRRGEPHPFCRASKQRHLELVFEEPNLSADGRLCDVQLTGGSAYVLFLGDRHEVLELSETHVSQASWFLLA
jgi:hypothetical protein